jgi:hypothetical protein
MNATHHSANKTLNASSPNNTYTTRQFYQDVRQQKPPQGLGAEIPAKSRAMISRCQTITAAKRLGGSQILNMRLSIWYHCIGIATLSLGLDELETQNKIGQLYKPSVLALTYVLARFTRTYLPTINNQSCPT